MKKYIYICVLGILGAMSRYAIKSIDLSQFFKDFPVNTLIINVIGCLFFSLIFTLAYETNRIDPDLRLGITAGFLSAFTTFSTFCRESITLVLHGMYINAFCYIAVSLFLGFMISWAGAFLAKTFVIKTLRKLKKLYLAGNTTISQINSR
jgi:CrcB protein